MAVFGSIGFIISAVVYALTTAFLIFRAIRSRCHFYTTLAVASAFITLQTSLVAHAMSAHLSTYDLFDILAASGVFALISTWLVYTVALLMFARWVASVRAGLKWSGVARAIIYVALVVFTVAWVVPMGMVVGLLVGEKIYIGSHSTISIGVRPPLLGLLLAIPLLWILMILLAVALFFATRQLTATGKAGKDKRVQLLRITLVFLLALIIILALLARNEAALYVAMVLTWLQLLVMGVGEMAAHVSLVLYEQPKAVV